MINIDDYVNENKTEHNKKWPQRPDHPYRIIIIGSSGSGKTNTLLHLLNEKNYIDKIYSYARDLSEPKYKYLIKKREDVGIKHLNNPNALSNVQIQWMMFMRILMITIQAEEENSSFSLMK